MGEQFRLNDKEKGDALELNGVKITLIWKDQESIEQFIRAKHLITVAADYLDDLARMRFAASLESFDKNGLNSFSSLLKQKLDMYAQVFWDVPPMPTDVYDMSLLNVFKSVWNVVTKGDLSIFCGNSELANMFDEKAAKYFKLYKLGIGIITLDLFLGKDNHVYNKTIECLQNYINLRCCAENSRQPLLRPPMTSGGDPYQRDDTEIKDILTPALVSIRIELGII